MNVVKGAFALFAGLFALMACVINVRADNSDFRYTESLIDRGRTCSVTIHEYESNNGDAAVRVDGSIIAAEGLLPDGAIPVSDVGFCYMKIADLDLSKADKSGELSSACYTELSPVLLDLLTELQITSNYDPEKRYRADEITDLIHAADAISVSSVAELAAGYGERLPDTDEEGVTVASGLTSGIYLFAQTKSPEGNIPCEPFCVALPQTNISEISTGTKKYGPGEVWLYDISVYPKSRSVAIHKAIVTTEKNEEGKITGEKQVSSLTSCIGDTVRFAVTADVPKLSEGTRIRKYVIEDAMDPGLTCSGDIRLTFGESMDKAAPLTVNSDYKLDTSSGPGVVRIVFTKKGLARLGDIERESHVYLRYSAHLGSGAVIGDPGNMNSVSLLYGTDHSGDIRAVSPPVTVFTYMLTLKKTFSPVQEHFGDVKFSLSDGKEKKYFVKESDGVYRTASSDEENDQTILTSPNDSTGVLVLKGLANGTYTLTEEETIPDYSLLGESIELTVRNRNLSVDVENRKSIDLVHTGGGGLIPIVSGAALMIAVGCLIILRAACGSKDMGDRS